MVRIASFFAALFLASAALAQAYTGTFTVPNAQGGTLTLAIKQDAGGQVTGTLSGNGNTFQVKAVVNAEGLYGTVESQGGTLLIAAQLEGRSLKVVLAEPLPNGKPNMQAARRLVMARQGGGGSPSSASAAAPAPARPANPMNPTAPGQDGQISQFLMGNAWCGFTYNKVSGASHTERIVFQGNGIVASSSGSQTYSSGAYGSVAGQSAGGGQGRWKVQNTTLLLSRDGINWEPQTVEVTRNSNGSPILKSGGKEYMVCR
jgi:hypothetical protein